jgi:hypothetical protein
MHRISFDDLFTQLVKMSIFNCNMDQLNMQYFCLSIGEFNARVKRRMISLLPYNMNQIKLCSAFGMWVDQNNYDEVMELLETHFNDRKDGRRQFDLYLRGQGYTFTQ